MHNDDDFLGVFNDVLAHAQAKYPQEACGLLVRKAGVVAYVPCRNLMAMTDARDRFEVDPRDWAAAEDEGEVMAVVHSHPDADASPSETDKRECHRSGLVWYVVAVPGFAWKAVRPEPLPLVGRLFEHGTVDCYGLIQDYFAQELNIALPDFERADEWWVGNDSKPAANLYRENFGKAGFVELGLVEPQEHDVLLMRVKADRENHAAVFVKPHEFGPRILHHLVDRLSGHDVWGGYWARHTTTVLRHRSLLSKAALAYVDAEVAP